MCVLLSLASVNKHCFRPVWYVGQKALFLTRALLFPLPTWVDYRLYWNTPEKRSKRRVKVLELQLGSLSFSSRKGEKKRERKKKRNRDSNVNPKQPTFKKFLFAQDTFYIFQKDSIWFWLNNHRVFGWESFNVKLDGKQVLSSVFRFSEPTFPGIVTKQATIVPVLTESRSRKLFNYRVNLVKLIGIFWIFIPVNSTAGY